MAALVSREQKVSLVMSVNGVVLLVVTMALPYWFQISVAGSQQPVVRDMGLWKLCGRNITTQEDCVSLNGSPSWITGPEILECMSLTCAVAALGLFFRMIFAKSRPVCFLTATLASVAGILGLAGALVFQKKVEMGEAEEGEKEEVEEKWCFGINVAASAFTLASGLVLYLHVFVLTRLRSRNYREIP